MCGTNLFGYKFYRTEKCLIINYNLTVGDAKTGSEIFVVINLLIMKTHFKKLTKLLKSK